MSAVDEAIAAMDSAFNALEKGDIDEFTKILARAATPDVEFSSAINTAISGGISRGRMAVVLWFQEFLDTLETLRWSDRRYEAVGDDAFLAFTMFEARGSASGLRIVSEVGQLYELDEGLIKRGESFRSHAEARAAAEALHP